MLLTATHHGCDCAVCASGGPAHRQNGRIRSTSSIEEIIAAQTRQPEQLDEDTLIEHLPLGKKTIQSLRSLSVVRLGDFAYVTPQELRSRARIGRITLRKIDDWLMRSNVPFRSDARPSTSSPRRIPPARALPSGDTLIDAMPLGPRALNSLKANGIKRLSDLRKLDEKGLRNLPWIGAKVAHDLHAWYICAFGARSTGQS